MAVLYAEMIFLTNKAIEVGFGMLGSASRVAAIQNAANSPLDDLLEGPVSPTPSSLSNVETRRWYLDQEAKIPQIIDKTKPLEQQAKQAFEFRNQIRTQAREAMSDRALAEQLFGTRPNMTWEQITGKYTNRGLSGGELYQEIIEASQRSNAAINDALNVFPK